MLADCLENVLFTQRSSAFVTRPQLAVGHDLKTGGRCAGASDEEEQQRKRPKTDDPGLEEDRPSSQSTL